MTISSLSENCCAILAALLSRFFCGWIPADPQDLPFLQTSRSLHGAHSLTGPSNILSPHVLGHYGSPSAEEGYHNARRASTATRKVIATAQSTSCVAQSWPQTPPQPPTPRLTPAERPLRPCCALPSRRSGTMPSRLAEGAVVCPG